MQQVVCFGEILWDNFPGGRKPGGAPMNVCLHLSKQGITSQLISSVGDDANGRELKHFLFDQGISTAYIQQHPTLPTGTVNVNLDANKQATYTIVKRVAWDEIEYTKELTTLIDDSDSLVFGSLACRNNTSHQTLLALLAQSKLSVFDINLRPPYFEITLIKELIQKCDVLKINEHELKYLEEHFQLNKTNAESQLKQLSSLTNTETICLTLGDKGAMVLHDKKVFTHAGFPTKVTDTVGAGDAFLAAFIAGYQQNLPMQQILIQACATGAFAASKAGANPDYHVSEIEKLFDINFTKF